MGLIQNEIDKMLKDDPIEWLAYKMVLPQEDIPKTTGDAMDIVKKYAKMAIESATENYEQMILKADKAGHFIGSAYSGCPTSKKVENLLKMALDELQPIRRYCYDKKQLLKDDEK